MPEIIIPRKVLNVQFIVILVGDVAVGIIIVGYILNLIYLIRNHVV